MPRSPPWPSTSGRIASRRSARSNRSSRRTNPRGVLIGHGGPAPIDHRATLICRLRNLLRVGNSLRLSNDVKIVSIRHALTCNCLTVHARVVKAGLASFSGGDAGMARSRIALLAIQAGPGRASGEPRAMALRLHVGRSGNHRPILDTDIAPGGAARRQCAPKSDTERSTVYLKSGNDRRR